MEPISLILLILICFLIVLFILLKTVAASNEKAKRLAEQVFNEQVKAKPIKKKKNTIIAILYNLSKAFYRMFGNFQWMMKSVKPEVAKKTEIKLELIGNPFGWTVTEYIQLRFFSGLVFFLLVLIVAIGNQSVMYYFLSVVFGIAGYFYPQFYVEGAIQQRRLKITQSLPDAMDFISLCLAAGMNFQLAVSEYVRRNQNLLADEFSLFHNEVQVGISRIEAFQHMLDRNDAPGLRSFLSSVIQSERLGTPLRPVISSQAVELRGKRKQMIEKGIQSAPIKMLFPLVIFILPAMMVIIFGSFLLTPSKVKKTFTITTEKTFFLRVTPGAKVFVNRVEFPIHHFVRDLNHNSSKTSAIEVRIYAEKGVLCTKEEEQYLISFFKKNKHIEEAWFVMIPLPEDVRTYLYIDIIAPNKKGSVKTFYSFRYTRFELYQFQEAFSTANNKKISIHGKLSPSINITVTLNNVPLEVLPQKKGDLSFTTKTGLLKNGYNKLVFQLVDKDGFAKTITKTIEYVGVKVDANFVETKETINDKVILTGTSTPFSHVYVTIPIKYTRKIVSEFDVSEVGKFSVEIPVKTGQNTFQIFCRKDGRESPVITRKIIRKLSE